MARFAFFAPCAATNRDGSACGNKVPRFASGVYVRGSLCRTHAKAQERRRAAERRATEDAENSGRAGGPGGGEDA